MPDKVITTPGSGKVEFINSEGVEKGSLELLESDSGSAGKDVVKVEGVKMDDYINWLYYTHSITLTSSPCVSLPASFTDDGLPIGVQLITECNNEYDLLSYSQSFEKNNTNAIKTPIDPKS